MRQEERVGAADGGRDLEVREMSNPADDPKWLRDLEQELGLDNTPEPDEEIDLWEAVKRIEFTTKGWARVYDLIIRAEPGTKPELFRRLVKNNDDALLFTAMIALPYHLGITLGYDQKLCERMITFVGASYVVALSRGYKMGQDDAKKDAGEEG